MGTQKVPRLSEKGKHTEVGAGRAAELKVGELGPSTWIASVSPAGLDGESLGPQAQSQADTVDQVTSLFGSLCCEFLVHTYLFETE